MSRLTFCLLAVAVVCAESFPDGSTGEVTEFAGAGGAKIAAYVRKPAGAGPFAMVINLHGGGPSVEATYRYGRSTGGQVSKFLAEGWAVYSIDYRGNGPGRAAPMDPIEYDDTLAAIETARHLPFVDSARIALAGGSHGGHVMNRMAARVNARCAVLASPTWIDSGQMERGIREEKNPEIVARLQLLMSFVGQMKDRAVRERFDRASALAEAGQVRCPLLIIDGGEDVSLPHWMVSEYVDRLRAAGKTVETYLPATGNHGFNNGTSPEAHEAEARTLAFLKKYLAPQSQAARPFQPPEIYRSVDRVTWVLDDLDRVLAAWQKTGMVKIEQRGEAELPRMKVAEGFLGDVRVKWIQPLGGTNGYAEYQKKHGSGIFSLVHRAASEEAFRAEVERLRGLGVHVLQREEGLAYMDTEAEGKYVLGLSYGAETEKADAGREKIVQFAFAVHELKPVSDYWAKLGLGGMAFNAGNLHDVEYWGKPIEIQQNFGWQRSRKVVYEWLSPVTSPNVFDDHMKAHGEGIHHIAMNVPDMEKAVAEWKAAGFEVASFGRWGETQKPGSGRFTYVFTEPAGGVTMELLWNYHP